MKTIALYFIILPSLLLLQLQCSTEKDNDPWPFKRLNPAQSGVRFFNKVENTKDFNIFLYRNFYNGAGVAIGDLNNDNLPEVFFTSNMGTNALFLNKGEMKFEDISATSGIQGTGKWATGVTLVDLNCDGWLDIYVCYAGYQKGKDQKNELYINNHDLTFTEKAAEYNLDENGYTTHAAFFDYDKDGDLDVYILNNSFMPVNTLNYSNKRELPADQWPVEGFLKGGGDKLLRNDNGHFTDVTTKSGIYSSLIGFGLGITVGDVDNDGWLDMYISNDFFERDYLYMNNHDGTFHEALESYIGHTSTFSMGADMADINNDAFTDIFVTDMLPSDNIRRRTTSSFDEYSVHDLKVKNGFYYQFMQNTLQLNHNGKAFREIAHYSGVAASDWSWAALIFDVNNDGLKDIYVSNGIFRDVTNQDFIDFFANDLAQKQAMSREKSEVDDLIKQMPSVPLQNKMFINRGDLTFDDASFNKDNPESFSNGSAYGDLDGDGDLDLVVSNVNQEASVFRNTTSETKKNHFIRVALHGKDSNTFAVGARVVGYSSTDKFLLEQIPSRGFQSSIDPVMIMGLGNRDHLDSLIVTWPDGAMTKLMNVAVDTTYALKQLLVRYTEAVTTGTKRALLREDSVSIMPHVENDFADFYNERLTMKMISREGPKAAVADVNDDGLEDLFICGAAGQAGQLYLQTTHGLTLHKQPAFQRDSYAEGTAAIFFDADHDNDQDLFLGTGGNQDFSASAAMQDRLYINDGKGNFILKTDAFPNNGFNTAVAVAFDFDNDNDLDLFVGSRSVPGSYGSTPKHFLYENDGSGKFQNVIATKGGGLESLGMVTDALLVNVTGDAKPELIVVGDWMAPVVVEMTEGKLKRVKSNLSEYSGWWSSVAADDLDGDGDLDLVLGNRGENFYFTGTKEKNARLWISDFDNNETIENIATTTINGKDVPVHLKRELTQQIVSLKKKNLKYSDYATKSLQDLFAPEVLDKAIKREANCFKSIVAINNGSGEFSVQPLPSAVQFSSVNGIQTVDIDADGDKDLLLIGNNVDFLPQYGRLDASFGHTLLNDSKGKFEIAEESTSGLFVKGEGRQILKIKLQQKDRFLFLFNNQKPKLFSLAR